ncbi:MAG: alkaline phosphatase family protein, partial [Bacillus sp. (in: firmicutes)]
MKYIIKTIAGEKMKRITKHMIIISFDCLSSLDMDALPKLPHFRGLLQKAAVCKHVQSVYPSLTYPCHATIVTGRYPARHGIINNTRLQPGASSPDWFWH